MLESYLALAFTIIFSLSAGRICLREWQEFRCEILAFRRAHSLRVGETFGESIPEACERHQVLRLRDIEG